MVKPARSPPVARGPRSPDRSRIRQVHRWGSPPNQPRSCARNGRRRSRLAESLKGLQGPKLKFSLSTFPLAEDPSVQMKDSELHTQTFFRQSIEMVN